MKTIDLLTKKDIREKLGVSNQTIWRWHKAGKLPEVRFSRKNIRYRPEDVQKLIEEHLMK